MEAREAILEGFGIKLTHGSTTVEVKDQDGKPEPGNEEEPSQEPEEE